MSIVLYDALCSLSFHAPVYIVGGDDWQFVATLEDIDGNPLDLLSATSIKWTLDDAETGEPVLDPTAVTITPMAGGQCSVTVPASATTAVQGGLYNDTWRVTTADGITQTYLYGGVTVQADPFAVQVPAAEVKPPKNGALRVVHLRAA